MTRARLFVSIAILGLASACETGTDRRSALADFYQMPGGCTGLTNRFLNTTASDCESANKDEAGLKTCVARRVGQSCMAQNSGMSDCAVSCVEDIAHPDR